MQVINATIVCHIMGIALMLPLPIVLCIKRRQKKIKKDHHVEAVPSRSKADIAKLHRTPTPSTTSTQQYDYRNS
ncbi:hypothetical protein KIN20_013269 [Parelaphostrongylus tenuis]|uniref:Uncharacterized protein n=1 Tax=Parelaphostrongylus tenuis TaxID=148309 RepID=A0AAD5MBV8_PARTN|nr:hypothetical protein KIN20_013269 [Parelaphostrongylus tenuis]